MKIKSSYNALQILCMVLFTGLLAKGQTSDEIIQKHLAALGGIEKVKLVHSMYLEGSIQIVGNDNPIKIYQITGKGYKSEVEFNGMKMVQCVTDQGGWIINPMGGGVVTVMKDEQYNSVKGELNPGGDLLDYQAKGSIAELLGKEGNLYKLKLTTKEKAETLYFIDDHNFLISKISRKANTMGQEAEITFQFSNYKMTDLGYLIPFNIGTDMGQFQFNTSITKAELNTPIDPSIFLIPK